MHYNTLAFVATTAFMASEVAAYTAVFNQGWGSATIENKCGSDVYFWEDAGNPNPPQQTILAGKSFKKALFQTGKEAGAGPSYKIAPADANGNPPVLSLTLPITQFEYTVDAPNWDKWTSFDISNVNGLSLPPFVAGGVSVSSPQDPNASKSCPAGQNPCTGAYTASDDDKWAMITTTKGNDIVMTLCGPKPGTKVGGGSSSGNQQQSSPPATSSSPSPTPTPTSTPPTSSSSVPVVVQQQEPENKVAQPNAQGGSPAQNEATHIVVVTEWIPAPVVTVVNYVNEKAKREEHIHQHAHAHQKINKRRHGA